MSRTQEQQAMARVMGSMCGAVDARSGHFSATARHMEQSNPSDPWVVAYRAAWDAVRQEVAR